MGSRHAPLGHRVGRVVEGNPFPLVLVCVTGIALLTVFAPALIVGDTWLTLMAGREIVEHGLPTTDSVTILGRGETWTDQQWLAQLIVYGAHFAGGIKAVLLLDVLLVLLALSLCVGAARASGATGRSTFLVALLGIAAGPWGWTVRAQSLALPLFVATLWLLADASRNGLRRRTLLVVPLLVAWANLHGSVLLGAGLAVLLGLVELVRGSSPRRSSLALVLAAPLCVLASPYAASLPAYYRLMLVDAPFAASLREWQRSAPGGTTAVFYLLLALAVVLVALASSRRRLTPFELLALGVLAIGAIEAIRGVIWFALGATAILPVALDGLIRRPDAVAPRLNRAISLIAVSALAAAAVVALALPSSWHLRSWPEHRIDAIRAETADPDVRVIASDHTADWLLWRIPSLRGRIAFDVRFELYDRAMIEAIRRYNGRSGRGWAQLTGGYDLVVLDVPEGLTDLDGIEAETGGRVVYRNGDLVVVRRPPAGS